MTVKNLATLDRDICQPLGRILQEAFADGFIGTGSISMTKAVAASEVGSSNNGLFQFQGELNRVTTHTVTTCQMRLSFGANTELSRPGLTNAVLQLRLDEIGDEQPDLSDGEVSALSCEYYIDETLGEPRDATVLHVAGGSTQFDYLLMIQNHGDCGESVHSASASKVVGFDSNSIIKKIPVKIAGAGVPYYILVGEAMAEVTPN